MQKVNLSEKISETKINLDEKVRNIVLSNNSEDYKKIKSSIDDYIASLTTHLTTIRHNIELSDAVKGDYAKYLEEFIEATCLACEVVINSLDILNDRIDNIEKKEINLSDFSKYDGGFNEFK